MRLQHFLCLPPRVLPGTKDLTLKSFYYHQRYGFLEVMDYTLNAGYILATAKGTRPGAKTAQICMWKAQPNSLNGSKIIHLLDSSSDDDLVIDDSFDLPIQSFTTESRSWAYVITAIASASKPVRIFNTSKLTVYLQEANAPISNVALQFIGTGVTDSSQILLDQLISDSTRYQSSRHRPQSVCYIDLRRHAADRSSRVSIVGTILYLLKKSSDANGRVCLVRRTQIGGNLC